jgi:hypothetical protein
LQDPRKPPRLSVEAKVQSSGGPVAKIVTAVIAGALVIAAVFLSVFLVAGLAVVAVVAGGWLWWRTRRVRRELRAAFDEAEKKMAERREQAASAPQSPAPPEVIEGDYIRPKASESVDEQLRPEDRTERSR